MNGEINLLTLISLIVAIIAIVKLRSVLGRRTPDDESRIDERRRQAAELERQAANSDKVVALPRRGNRDADPNPTPAVTIATSEAEEEAKEKIRAFAGKNEAVLKGLEAIQTQDRAFDPEHFVRGARQAYEMIVVAFAEGNRRALRDLLASDVFDSFGRAITEREGRGHRIDQSFVGINKADILEAELSDKGIAQITIRFVSQLISTTRDKAGTVIEGDDQRVKDVTDIWTFARDISTREARNDLNWKLVATQSPN